MFALIVVAAVAGAAALLALPFLVASVLAGQLQAASQLAAEWDVPPAVVPALQDAGQRHSVPWFLLAGIASVATDFARHAPDGVSRGDTAGTALFPVVIPAIGAPGQGQGMFGLDPSRAPPALADPQDVRAAADWLAGQLAVLAQGSPLAARPLSDPDGGRFWEAIVSSAPLLIAAPAVGGPDLTPVDPGANPIRRIRRRGPGQDRGPGHRQQPGRLRGLGRGRGNVRPFQPAGDDPTGARGDAVQHLVRGWPRLELPDVRHRRQRHHDGADQRPLPAGHRRLAGLGRRGRGGRPRCKRSPWGTRHFGSTSYAGRACSGLVPGADPPPSPPTLPTVTGADAVARTIVARAATYEAIWAQMAALSPAPTTNGP